MGHIQTGDLLHQIDIPAVANGNLSRAATFPDFLDNGCDLRFEVFPLWNSQGFSIMENIYFCDSYLPIFNLQYRKRNGLIEASGTAASGIEQKLRLKYLSSFRPLRLM